ncbi:MAG: hypothetical protein OK439_03625 [Thaumarchaeota archaeon]|nr:hypothetical protein [Nitrososphaerota archaeon]
MKLGHFLTIVVVALAATSLTALILGQYAQNSRDYGQSIENSFSRIALRYDYSCDENVYGFYVVLMNSGLKEVRNLSISITNPLCVGAVPILPESLPPGQSLKIYLYSTVQNGTIIFGGNDTQLAIHF